MIARCQRTQDVAPRDGLFRRRSTDDGDHRAAEVDLSLRKRTFDGFSRISLVIRHTTWSQPTLFYEDDVLGVRLLPAIM